MDFFSTVFVPDSLTKEVYGVLEVREALNILIPAFLGLYFYACSIILHLNGIKLKWQPVPEMGLLC